VCVLLCNPNSAIRAAINRIITIRNKKLLVAGTAYGCSSNLLKENSLNNEGKQNTSIM
jgi:hypothetical protein